MFPRFREQIGTALDLIVEFSTLGEYRLGTAFAGPRRPGRPRRRSWPGTADGRRRRTARSRRLGRPLAGSVRRARCGPPHCRGRSGRIRAGRHPRGPAVVRGGRPEPRGLRDGRAPRPRGITREGPRAGEGRACGGRAALPGCLSRAPPALPAVSARPAATRRSRPPSRSPLRARITRASLPDPSMATKWARSSSWPGRSSTRTRWRSS